MNLRQGKVRKAADYFVWGLPKSLVVENDILNANSGAHEIGAGLIITVLSNFNILRLQHFPSCSLSWFCE